MIIVKNRELLIPNNERYIGTTYDNDTENRVFQVPRFSQRGVDLANLTFRLDIQYANEAFDTVVLGKEVGEAFIILVWRITSAALQVPGTLYIGLRAIDDEATVKWSSFSAAMYAERHLNTPGNYGGSLTEIEQMEQDHVYMKSVVDELKSNLDYAHDAEAWAKGTRSGSTVPSTDDTYHNNSKYYSEQANTKATQAANSATAAANSATQAAETVADTNTRFNNAMAAVTSDTEVIDARGGADGTQYTVLKNRLDAEQNQLKSAIQYNGLDRTVITPEYASGAVAASSGNLVYTASDRRYSSTPEGTAIVVSPGTKVSLKDKTNYKYLLLYTENNTSWYSLTEGWVTDDWTINKQRKIVISVRRNDWEAITPSEIQNLIKIELPESIGNLRDFGFYKTFAIYDHLKSNGYMPTSYTGLVIGESSTFALITGFIPVFAGQSVKFTDLVERDSFTICFYDTGLKYVSGITETDGTLAITANGFIRICVKNGVTTARVWFDNYSIPDQIGSEIEQVDTKVQNAETVIEKMNTRLGGFDFVDGVVPLDGLFEIGSISISSSGWSYSSSTTRVRTKEGTTIYLVPGDKIKLSSGSSMRLYVGWKLAENNAENNYGTAGRWITDEYTVVQAAGYYVMTLSKVPESTLTSVEDVIQHVTIQRCVNLTTKAMTVNAKTIGVNHRGYNFIAPENTIPAFKLSKEMGFNYIETDVAFTLDGVPVLLHDSTIDRTSDGTGEIASMNYDTVRQYDFGSWKNEEYAGTQIPSLEELLQFCKKVGLNIFLELKSHGISEENVARCVELVKLYGMTDAVTWISYSSYWLENVKTALPTAELGLLTNSVTTENINAALALKTQQNRVFLDAPLADFTSSVVADLIAGNVEGGCFTPDTLNSDVRNLSFVKYVTTNVMNVSEALLTVNMS